MKHGPIHSEVYDLIKGGHSEQAEWSNGILNEVSQRFMGYDDWDVAEATHDLAEYKKTYRKDTSIPIPLDQVIEALGLAGKKAAIRKDAKEKEFFDNLFSPRHQQAVKLAKALKAKNVQASAGRK